MAAYGEIPMAAVTGPIVRSTPARSRRHAEVRLHTVLTILAGLARGFSRERAVALMVA